MKIQKLVYGKFGVGQRLYDKLILKFDKQRQNNEYGKEMSFILYYIKKKFRCIIELNVKNKIFKRKYRSFMLINQCRKGCVR